MAVTLPDHMERHVLEDMLQGQIRFANPHSVRVSSSRKCYVDGTTEVRIKGDIVYAMQVERVENGISIVIPQLTTFTVEKKYSDEYYEERGYIPVVAMAYADS